MASLFKDFEKVADKDAVSRYVNTPTIEQLYEVDKQAVDDFLDGDKKKASDINDEIKNKKPESITGTETLYLKVFSCFDNPNNQPIEIRSGNEGLFSAVVSLVKRFLSMIGNFFKWLAETFFGFGKRSQTDLNKLEAKIKAGEINYDEEVKYPANAKMILDSARFKSYPANLDWLKKELDFVINQMNGVIGSFTEAKKLFKLIQDKKVRVEDVTTFANAVAKHMNSKVVENKTGTVEHKVSKLVGSTWCAMSTDPNDKYATFTIIPTKQTEVTPTATFKVSEGSVDQLLVKLKQSTACLLKLAELSKNEKELFSVNWNDEKGLQGTGHAEIYALSVAFKTLVSFIDFMKHTMSGLQRADTAAHDIMSKAFK